jgi:hypothetical protein
VYHLVGECILTRKRVEYPFSKAAVYWCTAISTLSAVTSLLILYFYPILLISYFGIAMVLTFVMYKLKLRYLLKRRPKSGENLGNKRVEPIRRVRQKWRVLAQVIGFGLIVVLSVISLGFVNPAIWFMCLNGFVTSLSLSEVFLYIVYKPSKS